MIDSPMKFQPNSEPIAKPPSAPERPRAHFDQPNESLSLDGMTVDAGDLDVQDWVALGLLTHDDAVATYLRLTGK